MKKITGVMLTRKDIGLVLSVSFTEINEDTGQIISANQTRSKILLNDDDQSIAANMFSLLFPLLRRRHRNRWHGHGQQQVLRGTARLQGLRLREQLPSKIGRAACRERV